MSALATALLLALTPVGARDVEMVVTDRGEVVGKATLSITVKSTTYKRLEMVLKFNDPTGRTIAVRHVSEFGPFGRPIRKFEQTWRTGTSGSRIVDATFDAKGAKVDVTIDDKKQSLFFPIGKDDYYLEPSEFWFIGSRPKVGATYKSYRFNLETLKWVLGSTTYVGSKELLVAGVKIKANEIQSEMGSIFVDDEGTPYMMRVGNVRLERTRT